MLAAVQTYWEQTALDELLKLNEKDMAVILQSFAEDHSSERLLIQLNENRVGFEHEDERGHL